MSPDGGRLVLREGVSSYDLAVLLLGNERRTEPLVRIGEGRTYDVAPDGRRFLMIKEAGGSEGTGGQNLIVVQNWTEELKRLVPTD